MKVLGTILACLMVIFTQKVSAREACDTIQPHDIVDGISNQVIEHKYVDSAHEAVRSAIQYLSEDCKLSPEQRANIEASDFILTLSSSLGLGTATGNDTNQMYVYWSEKSPENIYINVETFPKLSVERQQAIISDVTALRKK